jgi:phosphate-selective porin OprO/OprP
MKKLHRKAGRRAAAAGVAALFVAAAQSQAQTVATPPDSATTPKATSVYDRIWGYTEWYRNDDHPVIQSFRFTGRFQLDYALVDQDDFDDLVIRRFRLGGKATVFQHFTLHAEVDLQPENDPVYQRLTDAYVSWSRNEAFEITLGKHSAPFTLDGTTSSKELLAVDRANLANNLWFPQEYFPGISVAGQPGKWLYHLGLYSSGSATPEFGHFDGSVFVLSTIGHDFAEQLKVKKAVLAVNYVHNEEDADNTFTRSLGDVGSVNFSFDAGSWGFRTDLSGGLGYRGQSDLWGVMLMPYYNLTSKLQAVARYTRLESCDDNGVRFGRYEDQVISGRGDEYNEFYLGLNYYFYKHKLKLQTGVQYADMQDRANDGGDYSGWAWTTALRVGW